MELLWIHNLPKIFVTSPSYIAATGETYVTPTVYDGTPALRAAFSNWRTTDADVDRVYAAITAALDALD
ncbi:hypothetical protein [Nocardia sp. NPDC050710]|uniref:hypothetical protein n=1 Tax=Nocardia sp. NPDC050710 TaxID=3157220 RepID=UPI003409C579